MEQIMVAVLTLLALYILYSECIKLPMIIKQNKKLCYLVIGGIFLYCCANINVDGLTAEGEASYLPGWEPTAIAVGLTLAGLMAASKGYEYFKGGRGANTSRRSFSAAKSPQ